MGMVDKKTHLHLPLAYDWPRGRMEGDYYGIYPARVSQMKFELLQFASMREHVAVGRFPDQISGFQWQRYDSSHVWVICRPEI